MVEALVKQMKSQDWRSRKIAVATFANLASHGKRFHSWYTQCKSFIYIFLEHWQKGISASIPDFKHLMEDKVEEVQNEAIDRFVDITKYGEI